MILCAADLASLPPNLRPVTRYFTLGSVPSVDRERWTKVLSFHCNALSTESDIVSPVIVPNAAGSILRVNLLDYGWKTETWEALAEVEPYFHAKLEQETDGLVDQWFARKGADGKWYDYEKRQVPGKVKKNRITAIAPWVAVTPASSLAAQQAVELSGSAIPIVDGRWFIWQTAIQTDRKPGYYDFIGIKDKATFDALIGFDAKLAEKAKRVEMLEAVAESIVTLQPRRIGAFPAISGSYWQTFDNREAVDEHNPLRILNGGFKFDATEVFGHLPNGLMMWGLFNADGVRQDTAPDFIASDATAHGTDRRVHAGLSCVRCHGVHSGIQPVDGWARGLFKGPLKLQSPDYEKLKDLRQKYLRDLQGPMATARQTYSDAIKQACGLEAKELAAAYGQAFAEYDVPVTVERAARDAGLTVEEFVGRLRAYLVVHGQIDTVVAAFIQKGKTVGVRQYHEAFPVMMQALRSANQ